MNVFETLLGKWESFCFSGRYARLTARRFSEAWEHVRRLCPDVKKPGDFDWFSVQDYRALRTSEGASKVTLTIEMKAIRSFYQWLQLQGHEVSDPTMALKRLA